MRTSGQSAYLGWLRFTNASSEKVAIRCSMRRDGSMLDRAHHAAAAHWDSGARAARMICLERDAANAFIEFLSTEPYRMISTEQSA